MTTFHSENTVKQELNKNQESSDYLSKFNKFIIPIIKTLWVPFLYYLDIISDLMFLYDLLINCHFKYFAISFNILVWSYVSTVLFLKYKHSLSWKKSLLYPHYHGKNLMKKLFISFQGKELPNDTTDELLLAHNIGPNHLLMKIRNKSI